jgi:hypothetical protein
MSGLRFVFPAGGRVQVVECACIRLWVHSPVSKKILKNKDLPLNCNRNKMISDSIFFSKTS